MQIFMRKFCGKAIQRCRRPTYSAFFPFAGCQYENIPAFFRFQNYSSYPPHVVLQMPALSPTMSQGNLASWKKAVGEKINAGDSIAEIETDKAVMDWEAQDEGYVAKVFVENGTSDIIVGTPVAVVVDDFAHVSKFKDFKPSLSEENIQNSSLEQSTDKTDPPPHFVAGLPALSPTMSHGNIIRWNVKEGDHISAGDSLAEIETDKAIMEWEAQEDGFVAKILVQEGAQGIPVGQSSLIIVEAKSSVQYFEDYATSETGLAKSTSIVENEKIANEKSELTISNSINTKRVVCSPYARKVASKFGVDILMAIPTGPKNRILAADVQKLISCANDKNFETPNCDTIPKHSDIPVTQIRRTIARRLLDSKQTIPHFYLTIECNVGQMLNLRKKFNEEFASSTKQQKLTINDFIIKAAAQALKFVPQVNASWHVEYIREYHDINVGIAVQTKQGLFVPVLKQTQFKGLSKISEEVKELVLRSHSQKLDSSDLSDGTFTISNLGMFGIKNFAAVVNPPQAAILAVGGCSKKVILTQTGELQTLSVMNVTLSCDHRVIDGAVGAKWLQIFKASIEDPIKMLL